MIRCALAAAIWLIPMAAIPSPAQAQDAGSGRVRIQNTDDLRDRPISEVRFSGLDRVSEQKMRNNVRAVVGEPFDPDVLANDAHRLNRLGEFAFIDVAAELLADGSVAVTYAVTEQVLIAEVQVIGNKLLSDQELAAVIRQFPGAQRDDFLIEASKRNIIDLYRERGNYLATVEVDETELNETGILFFRIVEGPRVRVRALEFEGNEAITDDVLRSQIKTETYLFLIRKGVLDEDVLARDVSLVDRFYKDRGFADVRVGRRVELSPDDKEAKVVFVIDEGRPYRLGKVVTQTPDNTPLKVYATEQLAALLDIKTGDTFSADKLRKSQVIIEDAYGVMGYVDVRVQLVEHRPGPEPIIDLYVIVDEGRPYTLGLLNVWGNFLTRVKVIRRETELRPGRPIDTTEIRRTQQRLNNSRQFARGRTRITLQDPVTPDSLIRDGLIEIKETKTGAWNFGIAAGTGSGVFGEISLNQRNFDITDTPETFSELLAGRAFLGAGQQFNMTIRPGNEIFQYQLSVTEPRLFDSDYALTVGGNFFRRLFRQYDQERTSGSVSLGRRFGEIWTGRVTARAEKVDISDIDPAAPREVHRDEGSNTISSIGFYLTRTTLDDFNRPGKGSRFEIGIERVGLFGGDFDFNRATADYTTYVTLAEDFLGRLTTLRFDARLSYAFGGSRVPTYERAYSGGRLLRGFAFRTVSPKGFRNDNGDPTDEPIGGTWSIFLGAQYEVPLYEEAFTGVVFLDTGTVLDGFGFEDYRVAVGAGIRLYLPALGPVPIAFDFAIPISSEDLDDEQLFSFSAELPF